MKNLETHTLSNINAGGCDFFTGLGCGASVMATILAPNYLSAVFAVASCGSLYSDCK